MNRNLYQKTLIKFKDEEYTVDPEDTNGLIGEVEENILLADLIGPPKFGKISNGLSAAINYAGGNVHPSEVHQWMFDDIDNVSYSVTLLINLIRQYAEPYSDDTGEHKKEDGVKKPKVTPKKKPRKKSNT